MFAMKFQISLFCLELLCFQGGMALQCLSCHGITHPRNCDVVSTCSDGEECYAETVTAHDGVMVYVLGCAQRNTSLVCNGADRTSACSECCNHDLCNAQLCGEQGYPMSRGPICYRCESRLIIEHCNIIDFCSQNEVCRYEQKQRFSELTYTAGCIATQLCSAHHPGDIIVGKRDQEALDDDLNPHNCHACCTGDLCNTCCNTASTTTTTLPTTQLTTTPPTTTSPPPPTTTAASTTTTTQTTTIPTVTVHDCLDILRTGQGSSSGVYTISLPASGNNLQVYCDMTTDSGGWIVFQNRFDGSVDFFRNRTEYLNGFGELQGEFWLGLRYIYELSTACTDVDLRIDLEMANGTKGYDVFHNFKLSPAPEYTLHLSRGSSSWMDQGSTGYNMVYNNGSDFYTHDHDTQSHSCATSRHGAWWFSGYCGWVNLNGEYVQPQGGRASPYGMYYYSFDYYYSLKAASMMLRCRAHAG